jgi:enoyl-CoA hydratase/carnithine racemase
MSGSSDYVREEREGDVVLFTLNAPERRNAISTFADCDAIVDAVQRVDRDRSVRCVILTGAGTAFCSGGDLKAMRDKRGIMEGSHADLRENYRRGVQRMANALYGCDAPTIAAVNGPAIGLGLDVATMCDIRIASEKASFAESFIKVGIVPGDGGAWLLPRVVGMSMALEMSFTGEALDAGAALAARLVSRVVPEGELMTAARDLARRIAANPPDALRMTKRLLREGQHMRLSSLLELSAAYQALAHSTDDHKEAVNAMLEKRRPSFTGR